MQKQNLDRNVPLVTGSEDQLVACVSGVFLQSSHSLSSLSAESDMHR